MQTVASELVKVGIRFEKENPVASLMKDPDTGTFKDEVLNERVLSALLEFVIEEEKLPDVINALRAVENSVDTVFSVGLSKYIGNDKESTDFLHRLDRLGIDHLPNGKTNVGLGLPRKEF